MEQYYYLYKDSIGRWSHCSNPVFIASHQHCRAIPKDVVHDVMNYETISYLAHDINYKKLTNDNILILREFDIEK